MIKTITNLQNIIRGTCLFNEPLSKYTTFNIGGTVGLWIEPHDIDDLKNIMREIKSNGLSWKVIGNGSNILAGEHGLPDIVMRLSNFKKLTVNGSTIEVEGGVSLAKLIGFSIENSLSGLEFLTGIPGQVGGTIKGNAGAQGRCIADVLKYVCVIDEGGNISNLSIDNINFAYRYSDIKKDVIILNSVFRLGMGESSKIREVVESYLRNRNKIFPKEPSVGCIFKNPAEKSAGRLIDELGLKGFTIGRAMVSYKHANVIINLGGASAKDVSSLIEYVREDVYNKTGIRLELEIDCWGNI